MVSFWPFKGDDTSAAHFEKTLAALSTKLQRANERDTLLRTRARRFKALWTLYTVFAYILCAAILALVTGYRNWGSLEYTAVLAGPVVIYAVRAALAAYYDYRIGTNKAYTKEVSTQRRAAIDKFKAATRYGETQQLLEKYGDEKPQPKGEAEGTDTADGDGNGKKKRKDARKPEPADQQRPMPMRTNILPPPTANIQRPPPPQDAHSQPPPATPQPLQLRQQGPPLSPAEAFSPTAPGSAAPAQYAAAAAQPQWYDRLLDVLLGDDETKPLHRLALICSTCRLVNGQAPPGVRDLAELGRWRCGGCKAWNGAAAKSSVAEALKEELHDDADRQEEDESVPVDEAVSVDETEPATQRTTRSRAARAAAASASDDS